MISRQNDKACRLVMLRLTELRVCEEGDSDTCDHLQ